jgi:hypothetical protein
MKWLTTAYVGLALVLGAHAVPATPYNVNGIFVASAGVPSNTLTGTIDITGGQITAMDLVVGGFASHFTRIYFNQYFNGGWILSGNNDNYAYTNEDYLTFNFKPQPGPYLIDFEQAKITNGAVVHNQYSPITTVTTTTYYGLALGGTICPLDGCAPFPVTVHVPGPVVGAGLPGLLMMGLLLWRRKWRG